MELNSWLRSLHEDIPNPMDSSRKCQNHLQTQGNIIDLNDDYNKKYIHNSYNKNYEQKHLHVHIYSITVPESPSPSTTATSSIISLFQSDSESDQSTDSLPPSPKQPRIEQEPEVSVVNIRVAHLAKRRSSLTEHEKYNFYCYHFTPNID